ncbi:hypothetical protein GIB67_024636 [Kingdonia uniflora]|uniref:Myb/SANT-like domain-containing protein n=1 Tax=Kingdonia uniflora TaxID=39325 RepID=A0A7J7LPB9_9MAGN|nr:hypothetical protein GIB67_024636 [Kingdonia uniflora]
MAPTFGRVYFRWDEKMDTIFINKLLEQRQHSQKTVSGWRLMAYNKASFNLKMEANLDVTTEQCKTRWKKIKANHLLVIKVIQSSSFRWTEETQLVTTKEIVWKKIIERDILVKNYRDKAIPHYRNLNILVKKNYATGAEVGIGNDETNIPQEGFEVDNKEVESVYSTIDERTPNCASSSKILVGASTPSTGVSSL